MQLVSPAATQVMRPQALESALARPLIASVNEPQRPAAHLAAQLSHSIITGIYYSTHYYPAFKATGQNARFFTATRGPASSRLFVPSISFAPDLSLQAAFFLANEYIRARGTPGLADEGKVGVVYAHVA